MITLFLNSHELLQYLSVKDKYINDLLCEINKKVGNKLLIKEQNIIVKLGSFFRKRETKTLYKVFFKLNNAGECQQYNFYSETSFGGLVDKSYIITLLLGILTGIDLYSEITVD